MSVYRYHAAARSPRTLIALGAWWAGLIGCYLFLDASMWILMPLALVTLPALYEIGKGAVATLEIDNSEFRWTSGSRGVRLPRAEVARVRLDTRLDFSLRMSLVLHNGKKVRLPYECVPPRKSLEAELTARQIEIERHHFSLMG